MIIVIDDERIYPNLSKDVSYCRNSNEALGLLVPIWVNQYLGYQPTIDELWLDHDLGSNDDIRAVTSWLMYIAMLERPLLVKNIYVCSQNPVGVKLIFDSLRRHYKLVRKELIA